MNEPLSPNLRPARPVYLAALAIFIPMALLQFWWIQTDTRPQSVDAATHLRRALGYADAFRRFSPRELWMLWRAEWGMYTYPPLFQILSGAFIAVGARPALAGVFSNMLFLWIAIVSLIQIGRRAFESLVGVVAAALFTAYMFTSHLMQNALLDLGLSAMVAWTFWRLLKTEGFTSRRHSVVFGAVVGLSMMVKQMTLPFVALPVLYILGRRWRAFGRETAVCLGLSAGAACLVTLPWYALHIGILRQITHFNQYVAPKAEGDPMPWTLEGASYYLQVMAEDQVGVPLLIMAAIALIGWTVATLRRNSDPVTAPAREARGVILCWLFGGLGAVTFLLFNKDYRYNAPVLPALALLTASLFWFVRQRSARIVLGALLTLAATPYLLLANVGVPTRGFPSG